MAEGFTNIYLKTSDTEITETLINFLKDLGIIDIDNQAISEEDTNCLSFNHVGSYNEKKLTTFFKELIGKSPELFIRARHYDDYATEIFWLNDNGKPKRYLHEVDAENGNIVKAYNHWHSNLGSIWDGHFTREDIQRISERFGFYDENGKITKGNVESLAEIVTSTESFFHKGIRAPYASHKFDNDIAVLQSYAAIMVAKSDFAPSDRTIQFERTFVVKDAFNSDVIGFVWSWKYGERNTYLVISWHGELAVKAKIAVDHEGLTTDEIIYICVFDEFLKKEVIGDKQWVYAGIEQIVYPPSMEYVWDDYEQDRDKFYAQGIVLQFMHVDLFQRDDGVYHVESDGMKLFEIHDSDFGKEMESIAQLSTNSGAPRMKAQIQVQFKAPNTAGRVLGIEIFGGEKNKCIYKRHDPNDKSWAVPDMP